MRVGPLGGMWLEECVEGWGHNMRWGGWDLPDSTQLYSPKLPPGQTPSSLFPSERRTGPLPINFKCSAIYPPFVIASRVSERVVVAEQGDEVERGCKIDTKTSLASHGELPHANSFFSSPKTTCRRNYRPCSLTERIWNTTECSQSGKCVPSHHLSSRSLPHPNNLMSTKY
jgi:hypothetical protein